MTRDEIEARLMRRLGSDEFPGVAAAYLFGSEAESDVDVGVLLDRERFPTTRERFDQRLRLSSRLSGALEGRAVDLVVLNDAPPHLARRIVTSGHRLFCADPEIVHSFVRDVQLRAADLEPFLRRTRRVNLDGPGSTMTYLVERLAELRRHLDHLRGLRPRIPGRETLERDLSLHNDVLFSVLTVCQLVIDIAGELSARRGDRFEDYTEAIRNLARDPHFAPELVRRLERLAGFRNVLVHEYVALDMQRIMEALDELDAIDRFASLVGAMLTESARAREEP